MTARISDCKNILYDRGYSHDVPPSTTRIQRIALASLPFLCLYRSFRSPVALGMGTLRVWNSQETLPRMWALIAVVATFFKYQTGQMMTGLQDIFLESQSLMKCRNKEEAAKHLLVLLNHLVYLSLISRGGLELSLISLSMQFVINLLHSLDEFKKDRWIEGCANLCMAVIRLKQIHSQYEQLQRNREIESILKKCHVGELHEKWRFPSDHLPVGIEVAGTRIISWNVLNVAYMDWVIEKDSQGLKGSLISELNQPVGDTGLTMRDIVVADMVQTMMKQGHVVALQECSEPLIELLAQKLPANWGMVKSFSTPQEDQEILLYDQARLQYRSECSEITTSAYPSFSGRPIQNAFFAAEGKEGLRIINAHIPGDPTKPGKEEFATYVHGQHREGSVTIALGDNNFEREEMAHAYQRAGFSEFSLHSPWKTNIDPYTKQSKGIDHFFVVGTDCSRDLQPAEVLQNGNLQESISLLSTET